MNTVTEAEAKDKRCCICFDRCLASNCMAWRWDGYEFERAQTTHEFEGYNPPDDYQYPRPEGDGWELCSLQEQPRRGKAIWWQRLWGDRRPGFCGRAEPRVAYVEAP